MRCVGRWACSHLPNRSRRGLGDRNTRTWRAGPARHQRHAINAAAFDPIGRQALIALQFRAGTNFPIPGYLTERDGRLFVGGARNAVRLPTYARLDVSANRTFVLAGRQLTVFAEVLNILNRANVGLANGSVSQQSGEATGFTRRLFGPLPGVGLTVRF